MDFESSLQMLRRVGAIGDGPSARAALASVLMPEVVEALAMADEVGLYRPARTEASAAPGTGEALRSLDQAIARLRAEDRGIRLVSATPAPEALTGWAVEQGCPWMPDGIGLPAGYAVEGPRVLALSGGDQDPRIVSESPILPIARAEDVDREQVLLVLAWRYCGRWRRRVVARRDALTRDGLLGLLDDGCPVDQSSATGVARWIASVDLASPELPQVRHVARTGWVGRAFARGSHVHGAEEDTIHVTIPEDVDAQYASEGTLDAWRDRVWSRTAPYPAHVAVLASLAAPLLRICRVNGWTLDMGGARGRGKTIAQRAAASVWGPGDRVADWPSTWAAMRGMVTQVVDLPVVLDDTKKSGESWTDIRRLIYQVTSDRAQVRGAPGGRTVGGEQVRTILISSGESPISDHLAGAEGAAQRVVSGAPWPWPPGSRALVDAVARASSEVYGVAGSAWADALCSLDRDATCARYRDRVSALAEELSRESVDGTGRLAEKVALVELAAELAAEHLQLVTPPATIAAWRQHLIDSAAGRDSPRESMQRVISYCGARPMQVVGQRASSDARAPTLAWEDDGGSWWILLPAIEEALRGTGHIPAEMIEAWRLRGWLEPDRSDRSIRRQRIVDGDRSTRVQCVRVPRAVADEVMG